MPIKYALGALLGGMTFWLLVVYYLLQLDPASTVIDDVDFMGHPNVRQLMADQEQKPLENPDHFAEVQIKALKPDSSSSEDPNTGHSGESSSSSEESSSSSPVGDGGRHSIEIVFGVCCRKDYSLIETLGDEFISVFYTTAIEPLQKATAMTPLKGRTGTSSSSSQTEHGNIDRLSTLLSTNDIKVAFNVQSHGRIAKVDHSVSPLMMIFTISGEATFLNNFKRQLWLKSPLLESGLFTTIEAHLQHNDSEHRQGVMAVRWVSPRYHIPVVSLNSVHLDDIMEELHSAKGIYKDVRGHHAMDSTALERQERRAKALTLEKDSLTQLIREASQCVYPRLNVAFNQLIIGEMRHLKTRTFYIQRQIENLQMQHESLSRVLKQTKTEYDFEDANSKSNTLNIAHLEERLTLLHRRRVEVIAELKKMVKRFEYMAHLIVYYEIYLIEKQRHEERYGAREFERGLCKNTIDQYECGTRAIFCGSKIDMFAGDDVQITAEVEITANIDHSIYLFANDECHAMKLEKAIIGTPLTTHRCTKEEGGPCEMTAASKSKEEQTMDQQLKALCLYVGCKSGARFKVTSEIKLPTFEDIEKEEGKSTEKEEEEKKKTSKDSSNDSNATDSSADLSVGAESEETGAETASEETGSHRSKATLTITKKGEGEKIIFEEEPETPKEPETPEAQQKAPQPKAKEGKGSIFDASEGSELQRTVTMVATIFFSVVALVMSVMFLPGMIK